VRRRASLAVRSFIRGAWADGSCWAKVIPELDRVARVTAVQLPLSSFENDVGTLRRAIALEEGPILRAAAPSQRLAHWRRVT
jgi:hypothetical protein